MNKVYSLAALLLLGGSVSAQRLHAPVPPATQLEPVRPVLPQHHSSSSEQRDGQDILFSEDFANGFDGNNGGLGPWTVTGDNGNIWRYTFTGPVGAYSDPDQVIESPTVANGFMIFNSDSANTDWTDTTIVAEPVPFVGSLVSPVFSLSTPAVSVSFSQRMRYCCSDDTPGHFLEVSTDGGTTWDNTFPTENGILDNDDPGTQTISVNIASALAGQPLNNVRIRFTQDGANGITHYHWQIDDIQIETLAGNDMDLTDAAGSIWDFNTAATYDSIPYSIFPVSQLRGRALNLTAFNNGANTSTNVQAHFTSTDGYSETVDLGDMGPGETQTAFAPLWTPTAVTGDHSVYYEVSSDSPDDNTDNNYDTTTIAVSDFIYARDLDSRDGGYNDNDDGDAFRLGNKFYINQDVTLYGIDVAFSIASATGVELNAQLLDPNTADYDPIAETAYHTLTDDDLSPLGGNHFVSFIFDTPVELTAGTDYLVVVQHFGGANVLIGTSGTSPAQTSNFYRASNDTWYYVTSTPMVRMNFTSNIGITANDMQNGIGLGQNIPNPAHNTARIDYSLTEAAPVSINLYDMSGKLVRNLVKGNTSPGLHRVDVNTADLEAGVYFYTLTTDKAVTTKRMTVVH